MSKCFLKKVSKWVNECGYKQETLIEVSYVHERITLRLDGEDCFNLDQYEAKDAYLLLQEALEFACIINNRVDK